MKQVLSKLKLSSIQYLLLLASIVYLFVATFTFHPDNKIVLKWAGAEQGTVWDVWTYGQTHYQGESAFNYPPVHFYLDKFQYFVAKSLRVDGYDAWLSSADRGTTYVENLADFTLPNKLGLLMFGIATGYLVYALVLQYTNHQNKALAAAALWLFNPITLYSIPIMSQNDVLMIFFFILGWLLLEKSNFWATISFGLAVSIKLVPLIWLPFLLISTKQKKWKEKILIFIGSMGIFVATLLPYLHNEVFRSAVFSDNHNQRFLYSAISLGFREEAINIVPVLLLLLLVGVIAQKVLQKNLFFRQAFSILAVNLLMLSFTHFHPQWWTWAVVFWSIWITSVDKKQIGIVTTVSTLTCAAWAMIVLLFKDAALTFGLLSPLNDNMSLLPPLQQILEQRGLNTTQLVNLSYSWLAGISLTCLILHFVEVPPLHEPLNSLKTSIRTVRSFLERQHLLRKALILSSLLTALIFCSVIAMTIGTQSSSPQPQIQEYAEVTEVFTSQFVAEKSYLNRIDVSLDNHLLKSEGSYRLELLNGTEQIFVQDFSLLNVGNPASVRFDIPVQISSQGVLYTVILTPLEDYAQGQLKAGVTNAQQPYTTLATQRYYEEFSDQSVQQRTTTTVLQHLATYKELFILLMICTVVLL